jgi:hypothetical protein
MLPWLLVLVLLVPMLARSLCRCWTHRFAFYRPVETMWLAMYDQRDIWHLGCPEVDVVLLMQQMVFGPVLTAIRLVFRGLRDTLVVPTWCLFPCSVL